MTAFRIHRTARPQPCNAPIHPMSREDAEFWRIFRERRSAEQRPA